MDVRCERCKTLYELDDSRVSEAGTTVRCTTCGHVFRVRKKVLLMTEAVGVGGESGAVPPPVVDKPAWRVRSPSGRVIAFRELTSMQKWIIERKFGREDEISLHGDHWKRLGEIAELQPFFLLLDEVDRVHQLEERLRRAEAPEEAPSALEDALGVAASPDASVPVRAAPIPTPTPIRLETPLEPTPEPLPGPEALAATPVPPFGAEPVSWPARTPEPSSRGPEPHRTPPVGAFSLEEIREATRPSPDDLPMPEGTVEPGPPGEEADQPQFTRRAGLGVDAGVVEEDSGWDTPPRRSKAPVVATFLAVLAAGAAIAAYFMIWVPAQEEKLRQEAQRARLEESQKARAAADAEVRERERQAKEELVAGMAGRADAGVGGAAPAGMAGRADGGLGSAAPMEGAVDAGTGGSSPPEAPRGSAESPAPTAAPRGSVDAEPPAAAPSRTVTPPAPPPSRPRLAAAPAPKTRSFDEWMALADRDREHARARAAVDAYGRAIEADGSRPEAYVGQGRAQLDLGDPRSAIAAFRRALMVNSRYSVAEFWLGEAYRRVGQSSQAVDAYGRYLEASPEGAEAPRAREALNALR